MYIIDYDIAATGISCVSLYIFYLKKKVSNTQSKRFEMLLWSVTGSSLFAVLSSLCINRLPDSGVPSVILFSTLYYLFHSGIPALAAAYVMTAGAMSPRTRIVKSALILPWILSAIIILVNIKGKHVFRVENGSVYSHGPFLPLLYGIAVFYLFIVLLVVIIRKSSLARSERFAILSALVLPVAAFVIESYYPGMMLECFFAAIATLFMLLTIQNSNELIDGQTGLYNRTAFVRYLYQALKRKDRFWVVFVHCREIARFHGFFDNHLYDHIMRTISSWFMTNTKKNILVSILDTGLFAFLLERNPPENSAGELALSIVQRSSRIWKIGLAEIQIPVDVAILQCPKDCSSVPDVMDRAEQLTGFPEHAGNRHIFFSGDFIPDKLKRETSIAYTLKDVLDREAPDLLYQPVYSVSRKRISALEVLVGLQLENGESVYQSEIVRIAEKTGLAQKLAMQVLKTSCEWYMRNHVHSLGIEQLHVRLPGSLCVEIAWPRLVAGVLKAAGMDAFRLCLEITESTVVHTGSDLELNMELLSGKGIKFALDDYGSGVTDFGQIFTMPFSTVKIDKKIIQTGTQSLKGKQLLSGIVSLFRRLGRHVVAEGIETAIQDDIMRKAGCDYLQGYRYGRPQDGIATLTLLSAR